MLGRVEVIMMGDVLLPAKIIGVAMTFKKLMMKQVLTIIRKKGAYTKIGYEWIWVETLTLRKSDLPTDQIAVAELEFVVLSCTLVLPLRVNSQAMTTLMEILLLFVQS